MKIYNCGHPFLHTNTHKHIGSSHWFLIEFVSLIEHTRTHTHTTHTRCVGAFLIRVYRYGATTTTRWKTWGADRYSSFYSQTDGDEDDDDACGGFVHNNNCVIPDVCRSNDTWFECVCVWLTIIMTMMTVVFSIQNAEMFANPSSVTSSLECCRWCRWW